MTADLQSQLDDLLAEPAAAVAARVACTFDAQTGGIRSLVLFGAGRLGRRTLARLGQTGLTPVAFSDNSPGLWGTTVEGLPVLSPRDAIARHGGQAAFVVTIQRAEGGHFFPHTRQRLVELGCSRVASFMTLYWKFPRLYLPYFAISPPPPVVESTPAVRRAMMLWADDYSRAEYVGQVRWRLWADWGALSAPLGCDHYFPPDVYSARDDELFVDCGAFTGDTIRTIVARRRDRFAGIHAFEPDPASFRAMQSYVESLPAQVAAKITLHPFANSDKDRTAAFDASGELTASISGSGGVIVHCRPLDNVLANVAPTMVKMDIEGAELDALRGAAGLIRQHRPVLAISAYHRQGDLWDVPLLIDSLCPGYRFYLRPHGAEGIDLVCYAVPDDRALPDRLGGGRR